jgi:hypothetical protein
MVTVITGAAAVMAAGTALSAMALTPASLAEVLFDNTLRVSNSVGDIDIFINRAGDYRTMNFKGGIATGAWRMDGSRLCLTQRQPEPPEALRRENCTELKGSQVGDRWRSPTDRGGEVTISIVAGRRDTR